MKLFSHGDSDMTKGTIWKQLLSFAVPMMVGLLFQQLYNTVDAVVVGQFVGKEALAAVGSTGNIINMLVGLCAGLSTGAGVVVSQCYGAHDDEKLGDAVHTTLAVTLILSVIATAVGMAIVDPMLLFMKTPDDAFAQSHTYVSIYFSGLVGLLVYNMGSGILRAVGDSRRPLYFLIISAVLNILLDLLFVVVFKLGVAGVAYATVLSQAISALLVLITLIKSKAPYAIKLKKICIKKGTLKRILGIGLPSGIQQAVTAFSNVFVQSYINAFGIDCMAGWTSFNKIDAFIVIPVAAIGLASTTFVGQNYGAGKVARARDGVNQALKMAFGVTALLMVIVMVAKVPLLNAFNDDPGVVEFGKQFVMLVSPFYLVICFTNIFSGALQGIGRAKGPMIVMLSSFVAFRQVYLFVNSRLGNAFVPVALAYPVGWVLCAVLLYVLYRRSELGRLGKTSEEELE